MRYKVQMSMTKWEGKPQAAHACLWLFHELELNIKASGTSVGYKVERWHNQGAQSRVEGKDGRTGQ